MKQFFKGKASLPDKNQLLFSSDDSYHKLDGLKIDEIVVAARLNTPEKVQVFIDYLTIFKCCMSDKEPKDDVMEIDLRTLELE